MRLLLGLPWLVLALPSFASPGNVLVVGAGQPYSSIQSAVDAASDRDTVLIMPGNYSGFLVDNKALAIVADTSGQAFLSGAARIQNLSPGKLVVLARLQATGSSSATYALQTSQNSGRILAERCTFRGATGFAQQPTLSGVGARIELDTDSELIACNLFGGHADLNWGITPIHGRDALDALDSSIRLYGCALSGGRGTTETTDSEVGTAGGWGGNGVSLYEGNAITVGCSITGGNGSAGSYNDSFLCLPGGHGGNGGAGMSLGVLPNQFASLQWRDCTFAGGSAGAGGGSWCGAPGSPGTPGQPIQVNVGDSTQLLGPARYLYGIPLARENSLAYVSARGAPGDFVYVDIRSLPVGHGSTSVNPGHPVLWSTNRVALGTIGASGLLDTTIPTDELGPGVQSRTWMLKPTFVDTMGIEHSGNEFALILVDQQF